MNRFRKNKKGKEVEEVVEQNPGPGFFKWKKSNTEPKPEFDLAAALPSQDDFRTSLLMPNLSARFSMLREQDDPNTKVGKANDDSVLFPKRASRLNLFGHQPTGLSDIAEVSSLDGRPSLALTRPGSQVSGEGYATDEDAAFGGNVMNRKRPGEGNNLFGGRQKVYRIPVGGSSDGQRPGAMRGRAVYEDDVTMSAFQRQRLKEKERLAELERANQDPSNSDIDEHAPLSPAFSTVRTTSSSTNSGRSVRRTSTAATSIDEQVSGNSVQRSPSGGAPTPVSPIKSAAPPPGMTKTRRLYGQGLAQAVHDQQSSALTRLETLSRQRAGAGTPEVPRLNRRFSRSATNLHERVQRFGPVHTMPTHRGASPPASTESTDSPPALDETPKEPTTDSPNTLKPLTFGGMPPLSPPISDGEDAATLAAALQPEDRGKATAMGLFNKPNTSYDEQQFSKRQVQMHEGRNTPPLRRGHPQDADDNARPRGLSAASSRSRAETGSSRYSDETTASAKNSTITRHREMSGRALQGTFFVGSESESEADDVQLPRKSTLPKAAQQPEGIHPAFRSRPGSTDSDKPSIASLAENPLEINTSEARDLNTIDEYQFNATPPSPVSPIEEDSAGQTLDSPTLGPSGLGLSGLVRAHLRQDSSNSFVDPSLSVNSVPSLDIISHTSEVGDRPSRESHPPASIHSNPWEYDDVNTSRATPSETSMEAVQQPGSLSADQASSMMSIRARQMLDRAAALRDQQNAARAESPVDPRRVKPTSDWQAELKSTHRRNGSTETQKEREEFANELAERRKKVQEKLKSFAESESRSSSPVMGRHTPDVSSNKTGGAFSLLKNKSTKHVPLSRPDTASSTKSAKSYILGNNSMNASAPSLVDGREDDHHILGKQQNSSSPHLAGNHTGRSRPPTLRRTSTDSREDIRTTSSSRNASPGSSGDRQRDRSVSISGRSKSRTRHRDDLRMVVETPGDVNEPSPLEDESISRQAPSVPSSARPSVEVDERTAYGRSSSSLGGRFRSGSRSAAPPQLDFHNLPVPEMTMMGGSPRPSPVTPYSANATPPLHGTDGEFAGPSPNMIAAFNAQSQNLPQRLPGTAGVPKRLVAKSQISEPTFLSCTSNVPTVNLPPGASLSNGMTSPPVPPMNPRRRRGTTAAHNLIGAFKSEKHINVPAYTQSASVSPVEERSVFADDEKAPRQRLRKISSEGGTMSVRARQQALLAAASQSSPHPPIATNTPVAVPNGMI